MTQACISWRSSLLLYLLVMCLSLGICTSGLSRSTTPADQASGIPLKYPWAGGLNSCQFCSIDLNLDGINDLLIFDRHGNRKLTFINHGTPNTVDYTFDPEYALLLPEVQDWVMTLDYDLDGKSDIFTYSQGGVRVFKNISDISLKFKLITDLLESFYYTGKVGILVTSVDYPALADIDNDGDTDLLTFFGLGSYVEYHQNLSMEKYGHCDSLDFRLADPCWGRFKESEGGNRITLNSGCPYYEPDLRMTNFDLRSKDSFVRRPTGRHTGSTLLATDLNNDGLKDLILGDVDYPGLVALFNGGTPDSALMVEQDTAFPAGTTPVHLFSFPAVSHIDIDNDGLRDLLVSPFDPGLSTSDNYNDVWFYKNTGLVTQPVYEKQAEQLFRNEMMDFGSASHPVLFDFDGDGLQDLFIGNFGKFVDAYYEEAVLHAVYSSQISYFKNTGTINEPVFRYVTDDLAGISILGLYGAFPALGDLDGDGRPDLLLGNSNGQLILCRNTGGSSWNPTFDVPILNWLGIDAGDYSAPQLFDLDKDGRPDLIIGEQNGNLNYHRNVGTFENPSFSFVTDSLGKVNVTNYNLSYYGFSTPCFSRLTDGTTILLAGSDEGRIRFFRNIDDNLEGKFTETGGLYDWLSATPGDTLFGWQTSPAIGCLTDQAAFDLITGNFSGGLNYITKRLPATIIPGTPELIPVQTSSLTVFPNPADQTVTISLLPSLVPRPSSLFPRPSSRLTIFTPQGEQIFQIPFNGSVTLAVKQFFPGIYIIRAAETCTKMVILHP